MGFRKSNKYSYCLHFILHKYTKRLNKNVKLIVATTTTTKTSYYYYTAAATMTTVININIFSGLVSTIYDFY